MLRQRPGLFPRLLSLLLFALVAACGSTGQVAPEDLPTAPIVSEEPEYRLGDRDVVKVSVWKNPDLSVEVPVRPDGFISVALVGDVRAGGRTPEIPGTEAWRFAGQVRS